MKRYDLWASGYGDCDLVEEEDHEGYYVRHEDVETLQALSKEALALLEEFIAAQFSDYADWEARAKTLIIKAREEGK